jgi:2-polyprenyl-3-methyl-5-hydroxy-6-metoxy-1,4-benzoquinol methylase
MDYAITPVVLEEIHALPQPNCYLCGAQGFRTYAGLNDRLYSAPGEWSFNRCPRSNCGLIWLDPQPVQEDIAKSYQSYYTHSPENRETSARRLRHAYGVMLDAYLAHRFGYPCSRPRRWLWPLMYLHPGARSEADGSVSHQGFSGSGTRLLDVGCGDGDHLEGMRSRGWAVSGVEPDRTAAEAAMRRGLRIHVGELSSLPDTEHFDVVTLRHVVEHVLDPVQLLRECHRVLRPGGTLIVLTPNTASIGHTIFRKGWLPLDAPRHIYLFSDKTLSSTLDRSGDWAVDSLFSTLRGSGNVLLSSLKIRLRGRHQLTAMWDASLVSKVAINLFYYIEWLALKYRRSAGEELCLIATKRPGTLV